MGNKKCSCSYIYIFSVTWLIFLFVIQANATPNNVNIDHNSDSGNGCQLPSKWHGRWYFVMEQSTLVMLTISNNSIDLRGQCKRQIDNQYLFVDSLESNEKCWRYLFFYERHTNVIQFKETACLRRPNPNAKPDSYLTGDSVMLTLLRAEATSEPCPLKAPFYFNYTTDGDSFCHSQRSQARSCSSTHQLMFKYTTCPEIPESSGWKEEIECFGSWSDKRGKQYFVAKLVNADFFMDSLQFRCFVHERKSLTTGYIGRSADSSCRALDTIKIHYSLTNFYGVCKSLPHWLIHDHRDHNKKKRWESIKHQEVVYDFYRHEFIKMQNKENASISYCMREHLVEDNYTELVVNTVKGCNSYYQCVRIFLRSDQVVELLIGDQRDQMDEKICDKSQFASSNYETLLVESGTQKQCPNKGKFLIQACSDQSAQIFFGCTSDHQLIVDYKCDEVFSGTYKCFGSWMEGGISFLVVREENTSQKHCFVYFNENEHMSFVDHRSHPCDRGILSSINSHNVFNASRTDLCSPVSEPQKTNGACNPRISSLPYDLLHGILLLAVLRLSDIQ